MDDELKKLYDAYEKVSKKLGSLGATGSTLRARNALENEFSRTTKKIAQYYWAHGNPGYMIPRRKFSG